MKKEQVIQITFNSAGQMVLLTNFGRIFCQNINGQSQVLDWFKIELPKI